MMNRYLIAFVAAAAVLPAHAQQTQPAAGNVEFRQMFKESARNMSVSDDGSRLVLCFPKHVLVWDIVKGQKIAQVPATDPAAAIIRGDKLIVAAGTAGGLSKFSTKDFSLSFSVETPLADLVHISAPRGAAFAGRVLVSGRNGLCLVDIESKSSTVLCKPPAGWVGAAGHFSTDGATVHYGDMLYRIVSEKDGPRLLSLCRLPARMSEPNYASLLSLGIDSVHQPYSYKPVAEGLGLMLIPDAASPVFYCLTQDRLDCRLLETTVPLAGSRKVAKMDIRMSRHTKAASLRPAALGSYLAAQQGAAAVSVEGEVYIFVRAENGVWQARTAEFDLSPATQAASAPAFAPVNLAAPVRQMEMSEDGKYLFAALGIAREIAVLDVATGKAVRLLSSQNPIALMCRGNKLFVGNDTDGTVTVFSLDTWTARGKLAVGDYPIIDFSAPGGKHFQGKLLATDGSNTYLVDTTANRSQLLKGAGPWNYTGNTINDRDAGEVLKELGGKPVPPPNPGSHFGWRYRRQYHGGAQSRPDSAGSAMSEQHGPWATAQDVTASLTHELYNDNVTTCRPEDGWVFNRLGVARTVLCDGGPSLQDKGMTDMALAATIEGATYIYAVDKLYHRLYRLEMPPPPAGVSRGEFPHRIEVGRPVRHALLDAPTEPSKYTLVRGPQGIRLAPDGTLDWTPTGKDVGSHNVKLRVQSGEDMSFIRFRVEVFPQGDRGLLGDAILVSSRDAAVSLAPDYRAMLVLDKMDLKVIGPDGRGLISSFHLDRQYDGVWQRQGGYLACRQGKLYLLDQMLKEKKEIAVPGQVLQVEPSPRQPCTYVLASSNEKDAANGKQLFVLDETRSELKPIRQAFADRIAMDPKGQFLFATFDNSQTKGYLIDRWGGVWTVRNARHVLVAYSMQGAILKPHKAVQINDIPQDILVSADGQHIAFRMSTESWLADRAMKLAEKPLSVKAAHMHPSLPLVLAVVDGSLRITDFSAKDATAKLDISRLEDGESVLRATFCPDGRFVLAVTSANAGGRAITRLRSLPLNLSEAELASLPKTPGPPEKAPPPSGTTTLPAFEDPAVAAAPATAPAFVTEAVDIKEIESFSLKRPTKELTAKEIGRAYMDSVAVIRCGNGSGTGFVIGSSGYILTCDHVLGAKGDVKIGLRSGANDLEWASARTIARDAANDLALLKVSVKQKLTPVPLAAGKPDQGEEVTVIGHPGLGTRTLDYTLTSGIVSKADYRVEKLSFIQTTATINPGNSGGPMFDQKGCLLGVVVLKNTEQEKTSFAIGPERIRAFLQWCAKGPASAPAGK